MGSGGGLPDVYTGSSVAGGMVSFGGTFIDFNSSFERAQAMAEKDIIESAVRTYGSFANVPEQAKKNLEAIGISLEELEKAFREYHRSASSDESIAERRKKLDGSHRLGLSHVPFDGYLAELHKGERVLTKREAKKYRKGDGLAGATVTVMINGAKYNDEDQLAEAVARRLQRLIEEEEGVYA